LLILLAEVQASCPLRQLGLVRGGLRIAGEHRPAQMGGVQQKKTPEHNL